MPSIRVRVPATSANLGPGFDALGLALQVYNFVSVQQPPHGEDEITAVGEGASTLNASPCENNIALLAARALFEELKIPAPPLHLTLENSIPLARGLGSSSAARVGALVAANEWARQSHGTSADVTTLLKIATRLEGHPDNVAPALLGGLVVSTTNGNGAVRALKLAPKTFPRLVVFTPDSELETKEARAVLPDNVFRTEAIFNLARASLLVGVLASEAWQAQPELLREALQDKLHQSQRAALMPAFDCTTRGAMEAGALGATLSGAGPSVLAWLPDDEKLIGEVALAMQDAAASCEVFGEAREVCVDYEGCVVPAS